MKSWWSGAPSTKVKNDNPVSSNHQALSQCVVPKISIPPPWKGSDFPGEGGGMGQFALFSSQEEGGTVGKYFQRVLVTCKRVTKKKHRNLPGQFICEDIKHDES